MVALSVAHGLLFPPGSAFSYSNINYVVADITRFNPSFFWASGALVSNVDDLDRFYDALFDARLLPRRLLAEMLVPVDTGVPGWGYGLG